MTDQTTPPAQAPAPDQSNVGGCQQDAGSRFKVFPTDHIFGLIKCCPCCDGTLTFQANGWEETDGGMLIATDGELQCSNEPTGLGTRWDKWFFRHFELDFGIRWLVRKESVIADLRRKVRFKDDSENNALSKPSKV